MDKTKKLELPLTGPALKDFYNRHDGLGLRQAVALQMMADGLSPKEAKEKMYAEYGMAPGAPWWVEQSKKLRLDKRAQGATPAEPSISEVYALLEQVMAEAHEAKAWASRAFGSTGSLRNEVQRIADALGAPADASKAKSEAAQVEVAEVAS